MSNSIDAYLTLSGLLFAIGTYPRLGAYQNLFAFEVVGVLLLAAVIGGVFLAKRERGGSS